MQEHTGTISSSPAVEYIRGSDYGGGIGGILYTLRSGTPTFNSYNTRGDVVSQSDNSGALTWQSAYEAFGTRTEEQGTNNERQKANTKDEDPTGLKNEGMRLYDLDANVFITRDPAGFVDGPNVYTYVTQNPWSAFDPLGLSKYHWYEGGWLRERGDDVAFMATDVADKATNGETSTPMMAAAVTVETAGKAVQGLTNIGNFKGMGDAIHHSGEKVGNVALNARLSGDSFMWSWTKGISTAVGEVTGANGVVEAGLERELGTQRPLTNEEQVSGFFGGVSKMTGLAAVSPRTTGTSNAVTRATTSKATTSTTTKAPTGNYYSVAFEMKLKPTSYPSVSRYMHFKEANKALNSAMKNNSIFSKMGIEIPRSNAGSIIGKSPKDWVWHHNTKDGIMQLVPKYQHPNVPGGIFWETMHPGGKGGYSIWGK